MKFDEKESDIISFSIKEAIGLGLSEREMIVLTAIRDSFKFNVERVGEDCYGVFIIKTMEEFSEQIEILSRSKIMRAVKSLEEKGVIVAKHTTGNLKKIYFS